MRLDDCFKKRLLRADKPDILKSNKALKMANLKIERAGELLESGFMKNLLFHLTLVCFILLELYFSKMGLQKEVTPA